jgi:hypothetical protein
MIFYAARTDNAFIIALLSVCPWFPSDFECNIIFIAAEDGAMWETIRLLRCSIAWARARRCCFWRLAGDTEYDMKAIARRLGAKEIAARYILKLQEGKYTDRKEECW